MARLYVELNREHCTLEELAATIKYSQSNPDCFRLECIKLLYRGYDRKSVEEIKEVNQRTLRHWVKRFNEQGIDGLINKLSTGRPRKLEHLLFEEVAEDKFSDSCYTVVKLHGYLRAELKQELSYATCLRYTKAAGYSLKVPRKMNPNADPELQKEFIEQIQPILNGRNKVFFGDEVGIEGDPKPAKQWFLKGRKPIVKNEGFHLRQSVVGAVEPRTGEFESIVVPYTDMVVFQLFLDQLAESNKSETKVFLILDNASWHHSEKLIWHNIEPVYLPPYSPELNPIERLWKVLKDRFFKNWHTRDPDKLIDRVCFALLQFYQNSDNVKSICKISY